MGTIANLIKPYTTPALAEKLEKSIVDLILEILGETTITSKAFDDFLIRLENYEQEDLK